jgi:hypothetical protein
MGGYGLYLAGDPFETSGTYGDTLIVAKVDRNQQIVTMFDESKEEANEIMRSPAHILLYTYGSLPFQGVEKQAIAAVIRDNAAIDLDSAHVIAFSPEGKKELHPELLTDVFDGRGSRAQGRRPGRVHGSLLAQSLGATAPLGGGFVRGESGPGIRIPLLAQGNRQLRNCIRRDNELSVAISFEGSRARLRRRTQGRTRASITG